MPEQPKILDLPKGKLMVVSDLHGNEQDYARVWMLFHELKSQGKANTLVFLGDLIHARGKEDASAFMVRDLIRRKANQPGSHVYALLGNHEMVHIYHIELWRGGHCYTDQFEEEIYDKRSMFIDFFRNMPFALRTQGGVLLNHTGPSGIIGHHLEGRMGIEGMQDLTNWSHEAQLAQIAGELGIEDMYNDLYPEIGEAFVKTPKGRFLWELLMNKNERHNPNQYGLIVERHLDFMSHGHEVGLKVMVNGHVQVPDGLEVVVTGQLRLSSGYGASSKKQKKVLVFRAKDTFLTADELAVNAIPLYPASL